MSQVCRYLIMAGGTGGHIFPAMAVARMLKEHGADVHWLGTETGMEFQLVPPEKFPLHLITIKGFRGKGLLSKLRTPFLLLFAIIQSIRVIKKVKADVVVGFGGYVSAPGGIAARLMGKKLIVHEQNSIAGSTNRLLAKIASTTLEAFPGSLPNAIRVGNPVRSEFCSLFKQDRKLDDHKNKKLLIMGGSLGALAINEIMPEVINRLLAEQRPEVWHQAGKNKQVDLIADYKRAGIPARVDEFITDVAEAYRWADVIVCRAGALTVSELAVAGLPAVFIPYPYAIDNHQFHNAQWLVENNAAYIIDQKELTVDKMVDLLNKLLTSNLQLQNMSANLKKLAVPDSTNKVVAICEQTCCGKVLASGDDSMGEKNNAA